MSLTRRDRQRIPVRDERRASRESSLLPAQLCCCVAVLARTSRGRRLFFFRKLSMSTLFFCQRESRKSPCLCRLHASASVRETCCCLGYRTRLLSVGGYNSMSLCACRVRCCMCSPNKTKCVLFSHRGWPILRGRGRGGHKINSPILSQRLRFPIGDGDSFLKIGLYFVGNHRSKRHSDARVQT
jgi:hypothetical protein